MCDGVAEEESKTLQMVGRRCRTPDDFLLDCHCVGLVVQSYITVGSL